MELACKHFLNGNNLSFIIDETYKYQSLEIEVLPNLNASSSNHQPPTINLFGFPRREILFKVVMPEMRSEFFSQNLFLLIPYL